MVRKHGIHTRVWVDGYNLTAESNSLEVQSADDAVDVSTFSESRKHYILGQHDVTVRQQGLFSDGTTAADAHDLLRQRIGSNVLVAANYGTVGSAWGWGGTAAPMSAYGVASPLAGAVSISAEYKGPMEPMQMLSIEGQIAGTGNAFSGTSGGSNNGAAGIVMLSAVTQAGTAAITHATAVGGTYNTLISFGNMAGRTAVFLEAAGSVRQFVRYEFPGSATGFISFRRR